MPRLEGANVALFPGDLESLVVLCYSHCFQKSKICLNSILKYSERFEILYPDSKAFIIKRQAGRQTDR